MVTMIKEVVRKSIAWVCEHPLKTAVRIMNTAIIITPTIFTTPCLMFLGFTPLGPAAGSIAATLHSVLSPLAAGSGFSVLQSAAMGGYGSAVVAGTARVCATVGIALSFEESESDEDI
ncbi:hypothetical protein MPH_05194 [Macrophomina phaseolina MS6]|uniref:Uncharacterized protein n=1 Tax=Macrophomina phaseolina (strain MS6) TaxID=1126212 RepID=K2RSB3_MACPH|nr:hypothetical protein MPH_05194 [Macrophomina phaseolina MS6]